MLKVVHLILSWWSADRSYSSMGKCEDVNIADQNHAPFQPLKTKIKSILYIFTMLYMCKITWKIWLCCLDVFSNVILFLIQIFEILIMLFLLLWHGWSTMNNTHTAQTPLPWNQTTPHIRHTNTQADAYISIHMVLKHSKQFLKSMNFVWIFSKPERKLNLIWLEGLNVVLWICVFKPV